MSFYRRVERGLGVQSNWVPFDILLHNWVKRNARYGGREREEKGERERIFPLIRRILCSLIITKFVNSRLLNHREKWKERNNTTSKQRHYLICHDKIFPIFRLQFSNKVLEFNIFLHFQHSNILSTVTLEQQLHLFQIENKNFLFRRRKRGKGNYKPLFRRCYFRSRYSKLQQSFVKCVLKP